MHSFLQMNFLQKQQLSDFSTTGISKAQPSSCLGLAFHCCFAFDLSIEALKRVSVQGYCFIHSGVRIKYLD